MTEFIPANLKQIRELASCGISRAAVAIGVFDGVHRGHQKLLTELLTVASELNAAPVVMTFFPHPRNILTGNPPNLLYPPQEKIRLLRSYGIQAVVTVSFTRQFSSLTPEKFLEQSVFAGTCVIPAICVGRHWKFGSGAAGNADFLEQMAKRKHFLFRAVDELCMQDGQVISSTAIRETIRSGNLSRAEEMLGRRYSLSGTVVHGYRNAEEKLHTPTANLEIREGVLPPHGVYAAIARLPDQEPCPAAVNIGTAPTFREEYGQISPRVEVHLLNGFQGDLYGREMNLELVGFIRKEEQFPDIGSLQMQIVKDIKHIRQILERS